MQSDAVQLVAEVGAEVEIDAGLKDGRPCQRAKVEMLAILFVSEILDACDKRQVTLGQGSERAA